MGFEPTTPTLARLCSTPELRPHRMATFYEGKRKRARGYFKFFYAFVSALSASLPSSPFGGMVRLHIGVKKACL